MSEDMTPITNEMQIMFWATKSDIYNKFKDITDFDELRKIYDKLWFDENATPIDKQAIKYFYLYRKSEIDNKPITNIFEYIQPLSISSF